ncbi:MAG TPA: cysteine--tRNA ligase [Acholeplasmatales bacterium]|nr:cysteine--tRNA ligase [Acholeplasmatales bacterium]
MVKIYNSLTKTIEEFHPIKENEVMIYVCGPTVYNYIHIGNTRPVIFFDTVVRFFKYLGFKVTYVSNYTDIDDKIINRAKEEHITEEQVTEKYILAFEKTCERLNCLRLDFNPRVTENMSGIIDFIQLLVSKDGAYEVDGDVYFDVAKDPDYGILSGQSIENMLNGVRIDPNLRKRNPIDFNLWKETAEGKNWPSPWSQGRPGWHTECVVMINSIFHGKIDIHGGGSDLKFPHHENEIAQSVCANGHKLANYWMHNGRFDMEGEKMSKSLGNVVWAHELLDRIDYQTFRLMVLNVPYRQPMNYKEELLEQAKKDSEKIYRSYLTIFRQLELSEKTKPAEDEEIKTLRAGFVDAMSDDFNTANAITSVFQMTKLANSLLREKEQNLPRMTAALNLFGDMLWVLGMNFEIKPLSETDVSLVKKWHEARKNKDFQLADELRQQINAKGIIL